MGSPFLPGKKRGGLQPFPGKAHNLQSQHDACKHADFAGKHDADVAETVEPGGVLAQTPAGADSTWES